MKWLLFTDNHYSTSSSIIRTRGNKYSARIENQLDSLNWIERYAEEHNIDAIACLGDFFDKPVLTDEEITGLRGIKWSNIQHYFLIGNHESSFNDLVFSSTTVLQRANTKIIDTPTTIKLGDTQVLFLPYIIESNRKPLTETLSFDASVKKHIVLSHNDIKGVQMGSITSQTGVDIDEIDKNCDLFINGHLHNGGYITPKILNLGNLTGQNFGENALLYKHQIAILDTDTLEITLIENPYALNVYKLEIFDKKDLAVFDQLKDNAAISVKCLNTLVDDVKEAIAKFKEAHTTLTTRLVVINRSTEVMADRLDELTVDHLAKFIEFCKDKINNTTVLATELAEVCK